MNGGPVGGTRLTLDLWHPDCWAIEATRETGGGILAHAVYGSPAGDSAAPATVNGLFTAFGDSAAEVDRLLDHVRASDRAGRLSELQRRFGRAPNAPGKDVREFFLEYDPADMACPVLLEHGFLHSAPVRIEDGREEWQVVFAGDRSRVEDALGGVREECGAEVDVTAVGSVGAGGGDERERRLDTLTPTQRDVFERAREAGYYEWPRETTTRDLADDVGVAKSTLLEHLRTAESKLLDPEE
ncbi:transcriptional regulator [Halorubrum sp. JWXQ-INN 858]|uniref:helix-turn-helix domain-containing protein n=1 Tax=Halorubrum sp. JWXQ-INN 858 TaxID=2690782 RepID=UPI00135775B8|nr:helix-turn-helix domain-containing protein [Halorubrum sp. JWXQ-INN 858]MWV64399.1 transcriptional regulator [Halorubrum sp. JWXQ-INN 858]